jgi:hypothetical protein
MREFLYLGCKGLLASASDGAFGVKDAVDF